MYYTREYVAEKAIYNHIESYLKMESYGYLDRIKFDYKIITDCVREEDKQHRCYKTVKLKK